MQKEQRLFLDSETGTGCSSRLMSSHTDIVPSLYSILPGIFELPGSLQTQIDERNPGTTDDSTNRAIPNRGAPSSGTDYLTDLGPTHDQQAHYDADARR